MGVILGFGSTEEEQVRNEEKAILAIVQEQFAKNQHEIEVLSDYYSDNALSAIKHEIDSREKALKASDDEFSANNYENAPERYYFCYYHFAGTLHDVFVGVTFFHINTKHALSPDGIALLKRDKVFWFRAADLPAHPIDPNKTSNQSNGGNTG